MCSFFVKRVVVFLILIYKTITWHEKPVLHILTTNCIFRILDLHTLDVTHGSPTVFYTDIKGRFMKLGDCLHGNQVRSSHKISKIIIILHKTLSGKPSVTKCQVTNLPNSPAYEILPLRTLVTEMLQLAAA